MPSCMNIRRRNTESMRYREVVIIDDGVNEKFIRNFRLKADLEVGRNLEIGERNRGEGAVFSHGTICAAILLKYAPTVSVSSIKVVDTSLQLGSRGQLAAALRWCLDREPMLIHLSIGTSQSADFDEIRSLVSKLYRKGFLIVAAYDNRGRYTVPAALECVAGVRCSPDLLYNGELEIYAQAPGEHDLTLWDGRHFRTPPCNSFAAPVITAQIYNGIQEDFSGEIADVWKLLGRDRGGTVFSFPDFLDHAVVIDVSGDEWPELFYFRADASGDGTGDLVLEENLYLVILADADYPMDAFLEKLAPQKAYVKGIFCCWTGVRSEERDFYGFRGRIWEEQDYIGKYAGCAGAEEGPPAGRKGAVLDRVCTETGEGSPAGGSGSILDSACTKTGEGPTEERKFFISDSNCTEDAGDCGIDVPVVYLYGERKCLVTVMQRLKVRFQENGYNVKAAGQFQRAYLYGFEYVDSLENRGRILQNIYRRFGCDMIICGIASREMYHDLEDTNFWLWGDDGQEEEVVIAVPRGNLIGIPIEEGKESEGAELIFEKILAVFQAEEGEKIEGKG